jgi:parallel beta-helix repeat protein
LSRIRRRAWPAWVGALALFVSAEAVRAADARVFYVRQAVGSDANDGLARDRAWRSLSKLNAALEAGDTAYVGPGLYRDQVFLAHSGRPGAPIRIVADPGGAHTGDRSGPVLVTGADPVDEARFAPHTSPGVYQASFARRVAGVVEMDGAQFRYRGVLEPVRDVPYLEQVAELPGSFYWEPEASTLYVHTTDGRPPSRHELELIRRTGGVSMTGKHYVTVEGFTFRHMLDAGIVFWTGSSHGVALNNVVWGSRQGIRVNGATNVLLSGNTLFRNENSGVYFMNASVGGTVVGNVLYGNAKGARWSSQSDGGLALANTSFGNFEAGLSVERVSGALLLRNRLFGNRRAQILASHATYHAEANCLDADDAEGAIALLDRFPFESLAAYRRATGQDRGSRAGPCGTPPEPVDVQALHARSVARFETDGGPEGGRP